MFEVGKEYIIKVTDNGFAVLDEFDCDRYIDIEHDDIDLLTEKEKEKLKEAFEIRFGLKTNMTQ